MPYRLPTESYTFLGSVSVGVSLSLRPRILLTCLRGALARGKREPGQDLSGAAISVVLLCEGLSQAPSTSWPICSRPRISRPKISLAKNLTGQIELLSTQPLLASKLARSNSDRTPASPHPSITETVLISTATFRCNSSRYKPSGIAKPIRLESRLRSRDWLSSSRSARFGGWDPWDGLRNAATSNLLACNQGTDLPIQRC